jgi:hypothetical protein
MGEAREHKPVKLVVGMFTNRLGLFGEAAQALAERFGPVDYASPILTFDKTDYYEDECGKDLKRQFYSFKELIKADELPEVKIFTNSLEWKLTPHPAQGATRSEKIGKRSINLDPGYITPAKLVLATTKDYQHRIYYRKGIYGEVTLRFKDGSFIPCEWTYFDYRTKEYIEILNYIRSVYMEQLKS